MKQAADRIRQAAKGNPDERLVALLHHITVPVLEEAFHSLKRDVAAGVDGMTWEMYAEGLGDQWHSSRAFCIVVHRVCWIMYCGYLCFLRCFCGHSPGVNLPSRSLPSVAWIAHYGEVFGWTPESRRCGRRRFSVVV